MNAIINGEIKKKGKRGFGGMSKEKQRAIASKGGRRAHELGKSHVWNSEEAAAAGRKSKRGGNDE